MKIIRMSLIVVLSLIFLLIVEVHHNSIRSTLPVTQIPSNIHHVDQVPGDIFPEDHLPSTVLHVDQAPETTVKLDQLPNTSLSVDQVPSTNSSVNQVLYTTFASDEFPKQDPHTELYSYALVLSYQGQQAAGLMTLHSLQCTLGLFSTLIRFVEPFIENSKFSAYPLNVSAPMLVGVL